MQTTAQKQENPCKIINFPQMITVTSPKAEYKPIAIPQMKAENQATRDLYDKTEKTQAEGGGMDSFPIEVYNKLIEYALSNGKYRDAMLLICTANWGMRIGDVLSLRFCHIFDSSGNFKENFTLPKGEQKTGKKNVYFNNEATMRIISLYLTQPENSNKTPFDYMFVSESGNSPKVTLSEIESDEQSEKITPSEGIKVRTPMTATAATDIIKNTLESCGYYTLNRKNKSIPCNLNIKLNNHSLRKLFSETFYKTGVEMKQNGKIQLDSDIYKLAQDKFMHSSASVTAHYNKIEEKAFKTICQNMNIGLEAMENFI